MDVYKNMELNKSVRLKEVDGIRGWAALYVLVFHLTSELFGDVFPAFKHGSLSFLSHGHLAVCIFFVLSGDALSSPYISSLNPNIISRLAIKRYFRLTGPIFFSCLLVYLLMAFSLTFNQEASNILHSEDWLGSFLNFKPDMLNFLRFGLFDVFINQSNNSYNPMLWPMGIEIVGSLFVLAFLVTYRNLKNPLLVTFICAVFLGLMESYFCLFFVGIAFSIMRLNGILEKFRKIRYGSYATLFTITIFLFIGVKYFHHIKSVQVSFVLAVTVVFCIYCNETALKFMRNRLSCYLGRISFLLYVTHFSVIVSFSSWMVIYFSNNGKIDIEMMYLIIFLSILIAFSVAEISTRLEKMYLNFLDKAVKSVFKSQT